MHLRNWEKLSFPISCTPAVQERFDRGVALLHSFAYTAAENAFQGVGELDPRCAMAHWGMAMAYFHQLWDPPIVPATISIAQKEIRRAQQIGAGSERERQFINALALIYQDAATVPYLTRAANYEHAMSDLASENRKDVEAQVFYALALLANASPADRTHAKQKQAADLLEPLDRTYPQHPGVPHYLIHAYDNAELAPRGLPAAKSLLPDCTLSAPRIAHAIAYIHATRLMGRLHHLQPCGKGSGTPAGRHRRRAARHGLSGVCLSAEWTRQRRELRSFSNSKSMPKLNAGDFKIAYASTAMPVRYLVERGQWADAAGIVPPTGAPPHVVAIAVWARGLGLARSGRAAEARTEIDKLRQIEEQLRTSGSDYWATQVGILTREVMAWSAQTDKKPDEAAALMRASADEEDAIEKLPVTPGPIVPAREQLGYLQLEQNHPGLALKEFETALANAPGRRGAVLGAAHAAELSGQK